MATIKRKFLFAHMAAAKIYSKLSHCKRLQVGALLVTTDGLTAQGYNGRPSGEPNVGETAEGITHPDVRHAEVNALKKITKSTVSSTGSFMVVTHAPCRQCAIDMVDANIRLVVYGEDYRDTSGIEYLLRHGVTVYQIFEENLYLVIGSNTGLMKCFRSAERSPEIEY